MIEIKCTVAEKERLLDVLDTKEAACPFIGLCTELPYYKTGMCHRDCIEHNIKWIITDVKPETSEEEKSSPILSKEATITGKQLMEIASNVAVDYYEPYKGGENLQGFLMSVGFMVLITRRLFKEDK